MNFKRNVLPLILTLFLILTVVSAISVINNNELLSGNYEEDVSPFREEMYAKFHKVSFAEAQRRFKLQEAVIVLVPSLTRELRDTYAGLWVEHSPDFKVVVLLTSGDETTLAPFLHSNLAVLKDVIQVREAKNTYAELRTNIKEVSATLRNLQIDDYYPSLDVLNNSIDIYVLDRLSIDTAVNNGHLVLPPNIKVKTVTADELLGAV